MILAIILLTLIILSALLLIFFIYYIFNSSLKNPLAETEPLISKEECLYTAPEKVKIERTKKKAVVLCSCNKSFSLPVEKFNKDMSCFIVYSTNDTGRDCKFACLGLGDCVKACPQQAISIVNHTALVSSLCIGCGKCVDICPLNIIKLVPSNTKSMLLCSNMNTDFTSCSEKNKEGKVEWNNKKGFKIWENCYNIIKHIK
ncbi:MAG: 4Fe-4S binding protein [Treponema sp.]|nr:4Fe-4S binding protein [Treponema sp.]